MRTTGAILYLALLAAGCAAAPDAPTQEAPSHRVPLEAGSFGGVAWLPNGWLVLSRDAAPDSPEALFRLRPDGSGLQPLPIPGDPACLAIRHDSPVSLGDGRVAFLYSCSLALGPDQIFVKAFDPGTGRTSQLTARPLEGYFSGTITWSTLKDRGMIGDSVAPCMSIAWLTPQGVEPAAITISEGERSWRLDELHKRGGSDCNDLGNAGWPAWSPDGGTIAFFAFLQAMGVGNQFSRLDAPWNLYLMDPDEQQPRKALDGVVDAHGLKWSPDGRWLAFSGEIHGWDGVWVYAPSTQRLLHISVDPMNNLGWSPDGQRIVGTVHLPVQGPANDELVILDVGALISDR